VTLVLGLVLSLLVAVGFHRLVELPSQRLARTVGARLQGAFTRGGPSARDSAATVLLPRPSVGRHTAAGMHGDRYPLRESYPPEVPQGPPAVLLQRATVGPGSRRAGRTTGI
jgi:hypothetical protein